MGIWSVVQVLRVSAPIDKVSPPFAYRIKLSILGLKKGSGNLCQVSSRLNFLIPMLSSTSIGKKDDGLRRSSALKAIVRDFECRFTIKGSPTG